MALMEPASGREDEFNDWYDLEHIPMMAGVPGIETAVRFVAVEGWPRYLAVYDLTEFGVLRSPGYRAVTGSAFTPWSRRNLSAVRGWQRLTFVEQSAGNALDSTCGALLLGTYSGSPDLRGAAEMLAGRPGVIQARAFRPGEETREGGALLVEARALASLPALSSLVEAPAAAACASLLSFSARYVRYTRGDPFRSFHHLESGR
jgi:hypothetical protein